MATSPHHPGQRRAQTYDDYSAGGPSNGYPAGDSEAYHGRSQSLRYQGNYMFSSNPNLTDLVIAASQPNSSDPPLPSYDALMAAENRPVTNSPLALDSQYVQGHSRGPSLDTPYAPVDYANPRLSYDHNQNQANPNRLSIGSNHRHRPISDPNHMQFSRLSLTNASPSAPPPGVQRHPTAPSHPTYQQHEIYPTRRTTGGYDGAASVYSLDTGVGVYSGQGQGNQYGGGQGQPDFTNPYYSAANEFLGPPPGTYNSAPGLTPNLNRTNTTASAMSSMSNSGISAMSSVSSVNLTRKPTESVGASSTRRRGMNAAIDVNRPPYTKQYVDDYRKRMKDDPDPEAQFNFAKYMIEAAKKLGDEIAQTDQKLGRRYRDALLQESLRLIKKLAEGKEPHADAQFFLANLYGTGQLGLQVDHEKAYYLYLMASKLNHPAATYRSAVCNEIGAGTKKDYQRAVLFYRKAAALGDTAAMYKLGMILLGGLLSQPRNIRESVIWLRRAASQADEDNPHSLHELALLHERPNSGILPHDPNLARELYVQAAQLGYAPAQFKLGSCHEFGHLGCVIDPRKSIAWYTRAAEKGDSEAELALSGWYLTGSGKFSCPLYVLYSANGIEGVLKQSDQEAYLWGRKAANKGLAKAEYAVGCKLIFSVHPDYAYM